MTEQEIKRIVDEAVDDMSEIVSSFAQQIADKLAITDVRFDMLDAQLAQVLERLDTHDQQATDLREQVGLVQSGLSNLRQLVHRTKWPISLSRSNSRRGGLIAATAKR